MRSLLTSLAVCAALMPAGAHAQDLSEEELLQLFLAQRDAYKAAVEGNTALTRGLTLVTADDVQIATEVAKEEPAAEDATTTDVAAADPAQATETVVTTSENATLVKMPDDMGVNVRIEFAFDSAALDDAQKPKLQKLCNVMRAAPTPPARMPTTNVCRSCAPKKCSASSSTTAASPPTGWKRWVWANASCSRITIPTPTRTAGWSFRR